MNIEEDTMDQGSSSTKDTPTPMALFRENPEEGHLTHNARSKDNHIMSLTASAPVSASSATKECLLPMDDSVGSVEKNSMLPRTVLFSSGREAPCFRQDNSDDDTIVTDTIATDAEDSFEISPVPCSPTSTPRLSSGNKRSISRKRTSSDLNRKEGSHPVPFPSFTSTKAKSSSVPPLCPSTVRKEAHAPLMRGMDSHASFDSLDSNTTNGSAHLQHQFHFSGHHFGITSARSDLLKFTGSPIVEMSGVDEASYADDDASMGFSNKIRRLNIECTNDCSFNLNDDMGDESAPNSPRKTSFTEMLEIESDSAGQEQELVLKTEFKSPDDIRKPDEDLSPSDVTAFPCSVGDKPSPPSPPVENFATPPVTNKKSFCETPYHTRYQSLSTWRSQLPPQTPLIDRKTKRRSLSPVNDGDGHSTSSESKSRFETDFEIKGTLGNGSFGTVYKCLSRLDGCTYAVKAMKRQARGKADRDRMLKEVYALAALCDLADVAAFHIVRYHQAWMEENRLYIQTELCTSTLSDELKNNGAIKHSSTRQYKMLRELLLALDLIHRNGMCHLDIKPDNIFTKGENFKLGDFGLVTKASVHGEVEEGDCRYMCMDLLSGNGGDLTKCDIFSLGASMYEIVRNQPLPTDGQEWQDIRAGKLKPMGENTPLELQRIIQDMLHPNPQDRPTAAKLLTRKELLSDEQKQLHLEKRKVHEANMALAAQAARLKKLMPNGRRGVLLRSSTCPR